MSSNVMLQPVTAKGWRAGFDNMLHKELGRVWHGRRWLIHALLWTALLNGLAALIHFSMLQQPIEMGALYANAAGAQAFFSMAITGVAIGIIVDGQGLLIGERQLGTAEWVLAKPVSREAFVLAKFLGNAPSFLALAVLLQGIIFYVQLALWQGEAPGLGAFAASLGLVATNVAFYHALVLMLGTFFTSRGAVAGLSIGVLVGGPLVLQVLPALASFTPWMLGSVPMALLFGDAAGAAAGLPASYNYILATASTLALTVVFVAVAIVRFKRQEI